MRRRSTNAARFARWLAEQRLSQKEMAEWLGGYSGSYLTLIKQGRKRPGLALATGIEQATQGWAEGPIRATGWVQPSVARARRSSA